MGNFKKHLFFRTSLIILIIGFPLQGNNSLNADSIGPLLHIIALSNEKSQQDQKKETIFTRTCLKTQKLARNPYVKKLFYGAVIIAMGILATYALQEHEGLLGLVAEKGSKPSTNTEPHIINVPTDNPVEKQHKTVVRQDKKNVKKNKTRVPAISEDNEQTEDWQSAMNATSIQQLPEDNPLVVQTVDVQDPVTTSVEVIQKVNHDAQPINQVIVSNNEDLVKVSSSIDDKSEQEKNDIETKKARYYELRDSDDNGPEEHAEFIALRNELLTKKLL